ETVAFKGIGDSQPAQGEMQFVDLAVEFPDDVQHVGELGLDRASVGALDDDQGGRGHSQHTPKQRVFSAAFVCFQNVNGGRLRTCEICSLMPRSSEQKRHTYQSRWSG